MQVYLPELRGKDFDKVPIGELFVYDDCVYMKTECIEIDGVNAVNVVNLKTGTLEWFDDNTEVECVKSKLTIERGL